MFKTHQPHYYQPLEFSRCLLCILIEGESPAANTYFVERIYVHILNETTGSLNYRLGGSPAHCVLTHKETGQKFNRQQLFGSTVCSVHGSDSERS